MYEHIRKSITSQLPAARCGCAVCHCEPCGCETGRCGISETRRQREFGQRTLVRIASIAAALVAIGVLGVAGQQKPEDRSKYSVAISLTQMRPVGAFGANIGSSLGVSGAFLFPLDRRGLLSLRADLGISEYGRETKRTPFSQAVGGRVEVDVRTTNAIVPGSIGIQLTPRLGPVEPYVNAGVGALAFFTESRVDPTGFGSVLASTTNHSDIAFAWTLGGGAYVPLTSRLPNVLLDVSVQYFQGARAEYLAPGSITDLDGGRITISPMESTTRLLSIRLGARIEL